MMIFSAKRSVQHSSPVVQSSDCVNRQLPLEGFQTNQLEHSEYQSNKQKNKQTNKQTDKQANKPSPVIV